MSSLRRRLGGKSDGGSADRVTWKNCSGPDICGDPRVGGRRQGWYQPDGLGSGQHWQLVQCADEVDKRLVSTLPSMHIALISTAALLPDLAAVIELVDPQKTAYLSFDHRA